jgi:hypothetical protein
MFKIIMPALTQEIIEYQAYIIAKSNELLDSMIALVNYEGKGGIAKQQLMKELNKTQIPIDRILAKFEGMLIVDNNLEGKSYHYVLNRNGRKLVQYLKDKNVFIVIERRLVKNVNA